MINKLLHPAGFGKRILAFLFDLLCAFVLGVVIFFLVGEKIIFPAMGYEESITAMRQVAVDSGLCYLDNNAAATYTYTATLEDGTYGYKKYEDIIWNYYTVYLPTHGDEVNGVAPDVYWTAERCLKDVYGFSTDGVCDKPYYELAKNADDTFNWNARPVLSATYQAAVDDTAAESHQSAIDNLLDYYYNTTAGKYVIAISHIQTISAYRVPAAKASKIVYLALIPAVLPSSLIFFLILPLCLKDGKTLGKLIFKLAVVSYEGFKASKLRLALRQIVVLLGFELLLLPSIGIGIMLFMAYFLIAYMILVLSKKGQALHDRVGNTIVVNAKSSTWFANAEEKENYIATHPSSLAAKLDNEERVENEGVTADGRKLVATAQAYEEMNEVLDLSTINRNREEARRITSFDEFEKSKDEEHARLEEHDIIKSEMISGATKESATSNEKEEENVSINEESVPEAVEEAPKDEEPFDEDAFVDEKK